MYCQKYPFFFGHEDSTNKMNKCSDVQLKYLFCSRKDSCNLPEKTSGFIATKNLGMSQCHIEDICYKDSLIISCLAKISPVLEPKTPEKCSDILVKLPGVVAT